MQLPASLQQAIELEIEQFGFKEITEARTELTNRYRAPSQSKRQFMTEDKHRIAYLAARMPATFAVVKRVLSEVNQRLHQPITTMLDLGAGPGTALWAAQDVFSSINSFTLMESDASLIAIAKRLMQNEPFHKKTNWIQKDLNQLTAFEPHDLITLSYSVGELSPEIIPKLIENCWKAATQCLVIIEPGTPVGFERIRAIRRQLIELNAYIIAPCPGPMTCPMTNGDWCHFSERIERSSFHRRLKEGTLGYEDEKYSYIAVAKSPAQLPQARILRHPQKHSGHVDLVLCTAEGLKLKTISKRDKDLYKKARKSEWGDALEG